MDGLNLLAKVAERAGRADETVKKLIDANATRGRRSTDDSTSGASTSIVPLHEYYNVGKEKVVERWLSPLTRMIQADIWDMNTNSLPRDPNTIFTWWI